MAKDERWWNSRKAISSHGCGARAPLNLIVGKCGQGVVGTAAASGSRGTSCVATGGRRAADETGGYRRILGAQV